MTKTVSVIVPVYNGVKTLERCVNSILAQKYTQFELILVDDGSTDGSGAICDTYAAKDSRIRVIHQKNGGASAARNSGLEAARGEYLMFCDCDDVVSPMWISRLMQYADGKTLPVGAYCQEFSQLDTEKTLSIVSGQRCSVTQYYAFNRSGIAGYICNSLFIVEIVKQQNLRFREHRECGDYNEDLLFVLQYVPHIENVVYTGYADYWYDTHEGSLSRSFSQYYFPKYEEKFRLWQDFLTHTGQNSSPDLAHLADYMTYHFLTALHQAFSSGNKAQFREIVDSDAVAGCLTLSDCPNENPRVLALLKQKASTRLWLLFTLSALKGRIKK